MRAKRVEVKDAALNITSLMDILTIVLIFLIINYNTKQAETVPPSDFELPISTSEQDTQLAVKLSIGTTEVRVEDKAVAKLDNGQFRAGEFDGSLVPALVKELKHQKRRLTQGTVKTKAAGPEEEDESEIIYLEAATGTRSDTLDRVLKSSAEAGFVKFRLAVQRLM